MSAGLMGMRRIPDHGVIAGVLAGIAEYFNWNVRLLRAAAVVAFIISGFFPIVVAYCLLWYVMDPAPAGGSRAPYSGSPDSPSPGRPPNSTDLKARFSRLEERLGNMEECVTSKEFELRQELKKLEGAA